MTGGDSRSECASEVLSDVRDSTTARPQCFVDRFPASSLQTHSRGTYLGAPPSQRLLREGGNVIVID